MKWNDAWLSNKDCGIDGIGGDPDGKLDRHYGFESYIGSGAWETNAMTESYEEEDKTCHWSSFTKFVAVPSDADLVGAIWYTAEEIEMGQEIWGQFAIIFDRYSDSCTDDHGVLYNAPAPTGFGFWN